MGEGRVAVGVWVDDGVVAQQELEFCPLRFLIGSQGALLLLNLATLAVFFLDELPVYSGVVLLVSVDIEALFS